jgi:3-hydroxyisobutyrate dehydrogenase-like beta-hydroxyacid dehydrogenase
MRVIGSEPQSARPPAQPGRAGPIAFIGAGQMGAPMVRRLLEAGLDVTLYARRSEVLETFAALGARTSPSMSEAVGTAEIIIFCLFDERQVAEVLLGAGGVISLARPGTVLVSHTTIGLQLLSQLEQAAADHGLLLLDAPVSGAPGDIEAGELTILVGGGAAAIDRALPALRAYGNAVPTGGVGTASRVKLINNLLFAVNSQTAAAAALLGRELGIEDSALFAGLLNCSAASRAMQSMQAIGSLDEYARLGAKYLRKDVSAALRAAVGAGADPALLAAIVADGPLPLTEG